MLAAVALGHDEDAIAKAAPCHGGVAGLGTEILTPDQGDVARRSLGLVDPGADPFHVVRVGNRCLDKGRRRVQNETLDHRGRKNDPLYRIRKLLLTAGERLDDNGNARLLLGLRAGDSGANPGRTVDLTIDLTREAT